MMNKYDSIFSAYKEKWSAKFNIKGEPLGWDILKRPRRQDVEPVYVENGALKYKGALGSITPLANS